MENINYLKNFYTLSEEERDLKSHNLFDGTDCTEDMIKYDKEIKKLQRQLQEAQYNYTVAQNLMYSEDYFKCEIRPVIKYHSRKDGKNIYIDGITGIELITPYEQSTIYSVEYKQGTVYMITGYSYNLGAAMTTLYEYNIIGGGKGARLKAIKKILFPIINDNGKILSYYLDTKTTIPVSSPVDMPYECKATEFINNMFNTPGNYDVLSLRDLKYYINKNKAFEVIIKTAPAEAMIKLFNCKFATSSSIPKMLEIPDNYYDILVKEHLLNDFIDLQTLVKAEASYLDTIGFKKTWPEYIHFLIDCKRWTQKLNFYHVAIPNNSLYSFLIKKYTGVKSDYWSSKNIPSIFLNKYKFGKFCNYIVTEAVDQGFTELQRFVTTLEDYLTICDRYKVKPTLYSREISKVHNIIVRNHQITFDNEQINSFKKKYDGLKDYKINDKYSIIIPKEPVDMQKEGDELNSCLTFYVYRVLNEECFVVFLRENDNIDASLVSIEIADNAIVQIEGALARSATEEERKAIEAYAKAHKLEMRA